MKGEADGKETSKEQKAGKEGRKGKQNSKKEKTNEGKLLISFSFMVCLVFCFFVSFDS